MWTYVAVAPRAHDRLRRCAGGVTFVADLAHALSGVCLIRAWPPLVTARSGDLGRIVV
jgi:hypothetical protein